MSDFYGSWSIVQDTPMGKLEMILTIWDNAGVPAATMTSKKIDGDLKDVKIEGDVFTAAQKLRKPVPVTVEITIKLTSPTTIEGTVKSSFFNQKLTGDKVT